MLDGAFDTHSHIQDEKLIGDFAGIIQRAERAGLEGIALCGYDALSNAQAIELAARSPLLFPAVGFHPHEADGGPGKVRQCPGDLIDGSERIRLGKVECRQARKLAAVADAQRIPRRFVASHTAH